MEVLRVRIANNCLLLSIVLAFALFIAGAAPAATVKQPLPPLSVSPSNVNVFSTPVAYRDHCVYTVNVEPAKGGRPGLNLHTVVRKGCRNEKQEWSWTTHDLDSKTLDDPWHTQPSIAVDRSGYIHVAYNMHNMPWQYAVSKQPEDISAFRFRGEGLKEDQLYAVKHLNKTPFPGVGTAAIPGNQITYPGFFPDCNGDLYITYRFALRPKRSFRDRVFSAGIARYDISVKQWAAIGGEIAISRKDATWKGPQAFRRQRVFATANQWTAYYPHLTFDRDNGMHVTWMWRKGGAGADVSHPSYAYSPDGGNTFFRADGTQYMLPISVHKAGLFVRHEAESRFIAPTDIAVDRQKSPYVVFGIIGKGNCTTHFDRLSNSWTRPEPAPSGASAIEFDGKGRLWAFSSGLTIYMKPARRSKWMRVHQDAGSGVYGYPKVVAVPEEKMFLIHCQRKDLRKVKIVSLRWGEL